jgi:hypothetical protein
MAAVVSLVRRPSAPYRPVHRGSRTEDAGVKLINTDGLAFIGPGSEWFWTALQFTALAITFIAIYRQLRAQHLQMRENTKVLRSQAHYNALMLFSRPWELVIENEGLASIVSVGLATPEALSAADWLRCSSHILLQVDAWEYFYYQHRDDSIPKELWVGGDTYYSSLVQTKPGLRRFWSEFQAVYDEPFRSYVAGEFAGKPASADATVASVPD